MKKIFLLLLFFVLTLFVNGQTLIGANQIRKDTTLHGNSINALCVDTIHWIPSYYRLFKSIDSLAATIIPTTLDTLKAGLGISGSNYNGSANQTWKVDTTVIATPTSVHDSLVNRGFITGIDTLKNGYGITSLSFNGSANANVIVDTTHIMDKIDSTWLYYPRRSNPLGYTTQSVVSTLINDSLVANSQGFLKANQTITLTGNVTGSGTTSITTTIGAGVVTNSMLAGSIVNSKLSNSTISGIALGASLDSLIAGYGVLWLYNVSYYGGASDTLIVDSTKYRTSYQGFSVWIVDTSSSMTGWVSYSQARLYEYTYDPFSHTCIIEFNITGTSNSTTTTLTLPYAYGGAVTYSQPFLSQNNGGALSYSSAFFAVGSTTLNLLNTLSSSAWTGGGKKSVSGMITYRTQ